jgi:hypothetical protein
MLSPEGLQKLGEALAFNLLLGLVVLAAWLPAIKGHK